MKNIIILLAILFFGCSSPQKTINSDSSDNNNSYFQEPPIYKELIWLKSDSINNPPTLDMQYSTFFPDSSQINKWIDESPFKKEYFRIRNNNVCIYIYDPCSGLPCHYVYIYKEIYDNWQLVRGAYVDIYRYITVKFKVDYEQEKILFKIDSTQIGELPFDVFDINYDKSE
jgi:hypothetical protein